MRLTLFHLAMVLGSGGAMAFDCTGVKLPSSIVICSDPELMGLADERQQVFNEIRWGIDPQRDQELLADQTGWVRSYATACGVPPSAPPPDPVPKTIKQCFKRAAQGRVAYLRAYGAMPPPRPTPASVPAPLASPTPSTKNATNRIGPSFDCAKATQPLAQMICASPDLSRVDLRFNQAYHALRQQFDPATQLQLQEEDFRFLASVRRFCGDPGSPGCVGAQYDRQREQWLSRLSGPAREEATRPIEEHVALQSDLQRLGFLPATATIDGVYGPATRAAIVAWQNANGREASGFLGNADAVAVGRTSRTSPSRPVAPPAKLEETAEKRSARQEARDALNAYKADLTGPALRDPIPTPLGQEERDKRESEAEARDVMRFDPNAKLSFGWLGSMDLTLSSLNVATANALANKLCSTYHHTGELRVYLVDGHLAARCNFQPDLSTSQAAFDKTLHDKPWMKGMLRVIDENTYPTATLSPAERRCRETTERLARECKAVPGCYDSPVAPPGAKRDLDQCVDDLRQEWMKAR